MLTFFIHFGLSFRQADHWLAPTPPPCTTVHGGGMNLHVRARVNNKNGTIRKQ